MKQKVDNSQYKYGGVARKRSSLEVRAKKLLEKTALFKGWKPSILWSFTILWNWNFVPDFYQDLFLISLLQEKKDILFWPHEIKL